MKGLRRTNELDISRRFHIGWILTIRSVELTADDEFCQTNSKWLLRRASCEYDSERLWLWLLVTSGLIILYFNGDIHVNWFSVQGKASTRICVEALLQLFVQFTKKHHCPPPPAFNSQNKTLPDVQRPKSFCREISHIYVHNVFAARAEIL